MKGRFIVFEGGEASGKSTQAQRLAWRRNALLTHQPGGTSLGRAVRGIVLDPSNTLLHARTETLLMAADKAQHVVEMIEPTLASGRDVVCDRYTASSVVYQGHGRGVDLEELDRILRFATGGLAPDLTVFLDVPDEVVQSRLGAGRDRFESEAPEFHQRVRAGYHALAAADPEGWVVVDGTGTVDEVAGRVADAVAERLDPGQGEPPTAT